MKHSNIKSHDQGKTNGQMNCPNCEQSIAVTFESLLVAGKLVCKNDECNTVLQLNRANSGVAINAIKTLKSRLSDLGH